MAAAAVIILFLVIIAIATRNSEPSDKEEYSPPAPPSGTEHRPIRKDYFIQQHLHRDDKKHARHKRNQTPW